jgi:ComF family protein
MHMIRRLLDLLLPATCSFCRSSIKGSPVPYFCGHCWSELAPLPGPVCPGCGRPFGSPESLSASPDHECSACRLDPPQFDQALAAGLFEGQLREAIHLYKYRPARSLGGPLAEWMARQVRMVHVLDIVMPVPLHRKRLRQRGFNQAVLLAHGVSVRFGIPLALDNLVRIRSTRPQVELSGIERTRNVAGAFSVLRPAKVDGRRVLLIDDVFTTGATMNECALTLKKAGARSVTALTLARTAL